MNLGTQSITRLRSTGSTEDDYGNDVGEWATPDELPITGCSVQPGGGLEVHDDREAITTLYTVWAPIAADVVDTDRVRFAGADYALDGPIEVWAVGTPIDHKVIRLKAVSG